MGYDAALPTVIAYHTSPARRRRVGRKMQGFSWLAISETGLDCFDVFSGKQNKGVTGRDDKKMKVIPVVGWMGPDGTVGAKFLDGTEQYSTMGFFFMAGRDGK